MPFPWKKRKKLAPEGLELSRAELLSLRPSRKEGVEWTHYEGEGRTVIGYHHEPKGLGRRVLATLAAKPKRRKLLLDEKGSFVWTRLDGTNRIRDLLNDFSRRFHITKRSAELSILQFLAMLDERGLIEVGRAPQPAQKGQ